MPHRVRVDHPVGGRGRLLHTDGGHVQELVHDLRGERLDRAPFARAQARAEAALGTFELARPDRLGARAGETRSPARRRARAARRGNPPPPRRRSPRRARPPRAGPRRSPRRPARGRRRRRGSSPRSRSPRDRGRAGRRCRRRRSAAPCARASHAPPARPRARGRASPVEAMTMSTCSSSASTASRPAARPPKRRASRSARSTERLATKTLSTPREIRFTVARSLIFPAPSTRMRRPSSVPKTRSASSAAAEEMEAGFSPIAVSLRTRRPTRRAWRKRRCTSCRAVPASFAVS